MSTLRVAVVQHDIVWFDRDANFDRLRPMIAGAAAAGAEFVALTETFSTGFGFAEDGIGEPEDGPSAHFLREQAAEHGIWIGGSCPEIAPGGTLPSNVFVLAGPDGTTHRYRKIHPFSHSGEDRHVVAGTDHVQVEVNGVRLTLFVCYDLRFADEFWATGPTTDAFVVVANWPGKRRHHWSTLLRARAIENQCYVVAANRIGTDDYGLEHTGDSVVIDPLGAVLVEAAGAETVLHATIDTDHVASTRDHFRFLQDRR
ncbi:MAG: nitrilase-related carbon-nitrogen hydrolase [Actinomycetota bacterium]